MVDRIVGDPIWKADSGYLGHSPESLLVDDRNLVIPCGRSENMAELGNGQDSGDAREARQISQHPAGFDVEHHHMAIAHVRDEKPAGAGVQTLVIKARGASRKGNIRDFPQER